MIADFQHFLDRHPISRTNSWKIIPDRHMLCAAVIPHYDRVGAPANATLKPWIARMCIEKFEQHVALRRRYIQNVAGEYFIHVKRFSSGNRVRSHHGVHRLRIMSVPQRLGLGAEIMTIIISRNAMP